VQRFLTPYANGRRPTQLDGHIKILQGIISDVDTLSRRTPTLCQNICPWVGLPELLSPIIGYNDLVYILLKIQRPDFCPLRTGITVSNYGKVILLVFSQKFHSISLKRDIRVVGTVKIDKMTYKFFIKNSQVF